MATFHNQVALITGGSSGIGKATALAFAKKGAKVAIAGRQKLEGEETVKFIQEQGGDAIFIQTDVSKAIEVEKLVSSVVNHYGALDIAFNNAGIQGPLKRLIDCTEAEFDSAINVNLKGVWLSMKYEISQMLKQGHGVIVNTSSSFGLLGVPTASFYAATKHGVEGLTKSAALEYAKSGIRVNAVSPGSIETPMLDRYFANSKQFENSGKARNEDKLLHPLGRFGKPEEVADAVLWLCSNQSSFVTGHSLAVDGGYIIQ